jgi:hypothetical protein
MNNLVTALVAAVPLAAILAWQVQQIDAARGATRQTEQHLATNASELATLAQEIRRVRREIQERTKPATEATGATPEPEISPGLPTAEELAWNNGRDWVWLEKTMLLAMGVSPIQRERPKLREMTAPRLSKAGEALMAEFVQLTLEEKTRLSEAERARLHTDPVSFFKQWATGRPEGAVAEIAEYFQQMTTEATSQTTIEPQGYTADPTAATLLGLEPAQFAAAQAVVDGLVASVRSLERERLEVQSESSGDARYKQLVLRLPPMESDVRQLFGSLEIELSEVMGKERAGYWMQMAANSLEHELAGPGKSDRKLTLGFDGQNYRAEQSNGFMGPSEYEGPDLPYLDLWWRPFVRRTEAGFELVK